MSNNIFRLLARGDFDGLVCAMLLRENTFSDVPKDLISAVDQADAAQYSKNKILNAGTC